jgi:DNA-binding NtrC family response regulator
MDPNLPAGTPTSTTAQAGVAKPLRILLVEDQEDLRETSLQLLELLGANAQGAVDAESAEAMLAREHFDVLITDITLPGRSGIELARRMAERQPALKVVFCSGYGAPAELPAGLRSWNLPKPYDLPQLERLLEELAGTTG